MDLEVSQKEARKKAAETEEAPAQRGLSFSRVADLNRFVALSECHIQAKSPVQRNSIFLVAVCSLSYSVYRTSSSAPHWESSDLIGALAALMWISVISCGPERSKTPRRSSQHLQRKQVGSQSRVASFRIPTRAWLPAAQPMRKCRVTILSSAHMIACMCIVHVLKIT